jgi:hypothetical protein
MRSTNRASFAALLLVMANCANAYEGASGCYWPEVQTHVRHLYAIYGPMSIKNEFFGFIYRDGARVDSAVVRSRNCVLGNCEVDVAIAAQRIPPGARVLGEWHTHPRSGSWELSMLDVRGAYRNRNVACYAAYFSRPDGRIFAWDPSRTSVPTAMASLLLVGNYSTRPG